MKGIRIFLVVTLVVILVSCCIFDGDEGDGLADQNETTSTTTIVTTTSSTSTTTSTTSSTTPTSSSSSTLLFFTAICLDDSTCCNDDDCPPNKITKNYTCHKNEIIRQYIDYWCKYAGSPSAECIGRAKSEFIKSCDEENERCIEDEPHCAFISTGAYSILDENPQGADTIMVNDDNFHPYRNLWIKIKYVISRGNEVDGLCLYIRDSLRGESRRVYLTDKFGNWINDTIKMGVRTISLGDDISAELWVSES